MKIIRLHGINDLRLEEVPKPIPQAGEVLLRTMSVGICGSDVHYFQDGSTGELKLHHPLVLGHEFSAQIASGPHRGQLVAVDPALPCGECEFCNEGNPNLCMNLKFAGADTTDGALQNFLAWPQKATYTLPEAITPEEGAMLEPLGVAIHALRLGRILPGMNIGVFGTGTIGLLTIQMARLAGAGRIFATDRLAHRLEYARQCGATDIFKADGQENNRILSSTGNRGLDVAFEAAGDDGAAVETAIQTAKRGATVVLIGIPYQDATQFTASAARRRGLTIKISRRMKNTYPLAINLVSSGKVNLNFLITHVFPPEEFQQAFQTARDREGIKVLINFAEEPGVKHTAMEGHTK